MIKKIRDVYNTNFSEEKYTAFLKDIDTSFNYKVKFKIAETPVFLPKALKHKLVEACDDIMKVINQPDFKELTNGAFFLSSSMALFD